MAGTRLVTAAHAKRTAVQKTNPDDDIRKGIVSDLERIEESWYEFSLKAAKVYDEELWRRWGYEKVEDYVAEELPSISYRIFTWRVQMGRAISKLGISKDKVAKMGWSKFKEISTLLLKDDITAKDADKLITMGETHSFRDVQAYVKKVRLKEEGGVGGDLVHTRTYRLYNDQAEVVDRAIKRAMEVASTDNEAVALETICLMFLTGFSESVPEEIIQQAKDHAEKEGPKRVKQKERIDKKVKAKKKGKK